MDSHVTNTILKHSRTFFFFLNMFIPFFLEINTININKYKRQDKDRLGIVKKQNKTNKQTKTKNQVNSKCIKKVHNIGQITIYNGSPIG